MNPWFIIIALFLLATVILLKSKHERHLLFFVVRTKRGIKLIDRIASLKPGFWKFFGDLGVVVSFSGMGVWYLIRQERSRKNVYWILFFITMVGVFLAKASISVKLISSLLLIAAVLIMRKIENTKIFFALSSLLISSAVGSVMPNLSIYLGLIFGFLGFPAVVVILLIQNAFEIIQGSMLPGVSPLLPTTKDGNIGMGVVGYDIFIPWWYALIAIIATFVPHEMSHGILARVGKIRLKSTGLLTFGGILLGAFVEPDEEQLKKKASISKMRVYSAGSMANFIVGILSVIAVSVIMIGLSHVVENDGVVIVGLDKGYPAESILKEGIVMHQINGKNLSDVDSFIEATAGIKPGQLVLLNTDEGVYTVKAAENPTDKSKGYMGVLVKRNLKIGSGLTGRVLTPNLVEFILTSLGWIYFFSFSIAVVNLLPIPPFDGYRMFDEIVKTSKIRPEVIRRTLYGVITAMLIIMFLNFFPLIKIALNSLLEYFGL